jgi:hypothetical protein
MSIQGNDGFLDLENASLRVTGNVHAEGLKVGSVRLQPAYSLQSVTNISNTTTQMVQFTNPTKGFDVTSNIEVGDANLYVDTTTGRVGVGTNAPMGTLDVKGVLNHTQVANVSQITSNSNVVMEYRRSKKLIKYPRVAMTSASSGGYTASASSEYSTNYQAWKSFDNGNDLNTDSWEQNGTSYSTSTGYLISPGTEPTTNNIAGQWVQLELPYTILLSSWSFRPLKHPSNTNVGRDRSPQDGYLFGSTDGSTWSVIENWTDRTSWVDGQTLTFNVTTSTYYKYFRLVWTRTRPGGIYSGPATVLEISFFGLPEYDPEAHGTDVVLHTTPNVPNTDFSNVYYDGQDYTSMPATVADKSGNGVTGTPSGGVGFDTTYKAFTFDGVDDQITATLTNPAGAWVHSTSMWFKVNSLSATNTLFSMNTALGANKTPHLVIHTNGNLSYGFSSNDVYFGGPGTIVPNKWYHLSVTYSGGSDISSRKVFLNSVELGISSTAGTISALDAYANSTLKIGTYPNGTNPFNGSIANFRLYNNALSADEIWELYAYQKEYFGVSPDVVTLKAGRLGIGTSEPRAVLDVRGSSRFDTITIPRALFNPGYSRSAIIYTGVYYRTKYQNVHEYYQNLIIPPASEMASYGIDSQWYTLSNYTSGNAVNTTIIDSLVYWLKNRRDGHIHESQFLVSGGTHFERVYGQKFATHFRLWGYGERGNQTHTKYYVSNYNVNLTSAAELNIYYSETVL